MNTCLSVWQTSMQWSVGRDQMIDANALDSLLAHFIVGKELNVGLVIVACLSDILNKRVTTNATCCYCVSKQNYLWYTNVLKYTFIKYNTTYTLVKNIVNKLFSIIQHPGHISPRVGNKDPMLRSHVLAKREVSVLISMAWVICGGKNPIQIILQWHSVQDDI